MTEVAVLVGVVFLLIFVLELLNAFYDAMLTGHGMAGHGRPSSLVTVLTANLRAIIVWVMMLFRTTALWFHELAHATLQFASGGMPRIVMCRGGGFAQARPWPIGGAGVALYGLGSMFWRGLVSMAPLLLGAGALLALVWFATPLHATGELGALIDAIRHGATPSALHTLPAEALGGARMFVTTVADAGALRALLVFLAALAIVAGMTPSSVDFINARWALLAYGCAPILAAAVYRSVPAAGLVLCGAGVGLVVLGGFIGRSVGEDREWWRFFNFLGTWLLALGVLGFTSVLGAAPVDRIATGVAAVVVLLVFAATVFLFFMAFMLGLTVLSLNPRPLWHGLLAMPREIKSVFTSIAICKERRMMFQDRCDYCQCTLGEFKKNGCQGKDMDKPKKSSFFDRVRKNLER